MQTDRSTCVAGARRLYGCRNSALAPTVDITAGDVLAHA